MATDIRKFEAVVSANGGPLRVYSFDYTGDGEKAGNYVEDVYYDFEKKELSIGDRLFIRNGKCWREGDR